MYSSTDSELCLPQQIARVSIRAVLIMSGGSDSAASDQCPATQGLQSTFTQFLRDQILVTSFRSGCTFLTTKLSSCVTRGKFLPTGIITYFYNSNNAFATI